jgi:hypothetical protein
MTIVLRVQVAALSVEIMMPSGDSRYWKRALAAAAAEVLGPMHCRLTVDVLLCTQSHKRTRTSEPLAHVPAAAPRPEERAYAENVKLKAAGSHSDSEPL